MTSSFRKTVEKLADSGETAPRMACKWCQEPTLVPTLNQYGARCFSCYEAYCRQGLKGGVDGFMQGAPDTEQQAVMRKGLRENRPTRNSQPRIALEAPNAITEDAKREARLKAERYARERGIELTGHSA